MKNLIFMSFVIFLSSVIFADVLDDGVLSTGEYYSGIIDWYSSTPPLIVDGGGATAIDIWNEGILEVRSTSFPINDDWHTGGISDIHLNNGELLYSNGTTDILTVRENSIAILKGGSINYIRSYFDFMTTGYIDLYCQSGWTWQRDLQNEIVGITGVWENNNPFSIDFIDKENVDPVWMGINVIEVPEPISLLLLSFGGLLIRRKL